MTVAVLAVVLGPSLLVFFLGCSVAAYRTVRPHARRPYRVSPDRRVT